MVAHMITLTYTPDSPHSTTDRKEQHSPPQDSGNLQRLQYQLAPTNIDLVDASTACIYHIHIHVSILFLTFAFIFAFVHRCRALL